MRYAVTYRIGEGKCLSGFAERSCGGDKVYASPTGGTPIESAVVVPFEQCPDEVYVVNPSGGSNDCSCLPIETCSQSTQVSYAFEPIYYTGVTEGYMTRRIVVPLPTYTDMSVVGIQPNVTFRLSTISGADEQAIFSYRVALASAEYDFDAEHINFNDLVSGVMPASNNDTYTDNLRALTENDLNNPELAVVIEVTGLAYQLGNNYGAAGVTFPVQGEQKKQQVMVVQPSVCDVERQNELVAGIIADVRSIMRDTIGAGAVAAQTHYIDQVKSLLATLGTQTDQLEPLLTQLGLNTDQVESKLDALITLLTPTTRIVKTGSGYISSGTETARFGGSSKPYESITGLQSITVTVVQAGNAATGADVVRVTTDTGAINLLTGMSVTFSVEQDSYNKSGELSNVFKVQALGNSAAIVHYTYEGSVT